jgi:hypothetical protein
MMMTDKPNYSNLDTDGTTNFPPRNFDSYSRAVTGGSQAAVPGSYMGWNAKKKKSEEVFLTFGFG